MAKAYGSGEQNGRHIYRRAAAGLIASAAILAGCRGITGHSAAAATAPYTKDAPGDAEAAGTEGLTPERLELLKAISVDEGALDRGELKDWQAEVLRQLEYAENELHERYPSYEFVIDAVMPRNAVRKLTVISFTEKADPGKFYAIELSADGGGAYDEKDDFWTKAIRPRYEDALKQYLEGQGIRADEVNALFSGVKGREFSESMDVQDIIRGKYKLLHTIQVSVDASHISPEEIPAYGGKVQEAFEELGLYAYYETAVSGPGGAQEPLASHNFGLFQFR